MPHRFPALIADPPRGEGRLWLTGGRLFDGTGGPVRDAAVSPEIPAQHKHLVAAHRRPPPFRSPGT